MTHPPVSSRAALAELERQRARRVALTARALDTPLVAVASDGGGGGGGGGGEPNKKGGSSKGSGRKSEVQRRPDDQKGQADPKDGEGRGAP